jgi:16S rRNA (cytidine1402-2'-O)-methyltransferase
MRSDYVVSTNSLSRLSIRPETDLAPQAPHANSASMSDVKPNKPSSQYTVAPGLHVVATPIGNLRDMTLRGIATLAACDVILAEDTRVTKVLLSHYGITTPLWPYHEHNAAEMRPKIMVCLEKGDKLALVSDAGTPLVSDPGFKLVEAALEAGHPVTTNPGPSAVLAALVLAGLPTDRFFFEGFLPPKMAARRARLTDLAAIPGTLVFFESPRRVAEMLHDAHVIFGLRKGAVARELTKMFENVRRGNLAELSDFYASDGAPRGEVVVLIGPPLDNAEEPVADVLDGQLRIVLAQMSLKEAVAQVTASTGQPRRKVYARALELTRQP